MIGRRQIFACLLVLVFLLMAGCGQTPAPVDDDPVDDDGAVVYRDTIVYAPDRDTDTLDLFYVTWGNLAHYSTYESLLTFDWDGNIAPGLAKDWDVAEDGLTITLYLRDDVNFHDGSPFNAQAVKDHFDTLLDDEVASPTAADFRWISRTEVIDEFTVDFHLDETFGNAMTTLAWAGAYGSIQSYEAWKQYGPQGTGEYGSSIAIGTGAFTWEEWSPADKHVLIRNENYTHGPAWFDNQGPAHLKRVEIRVIPEAATRLAELEAGNVDILESVPPEHVERVRAMPGVTLIQRPAWGLGYLGMATDKAPFNNVLVRRAINLAIDREDIVQSVFFGLVDPAYAYLPMLHGDTRVEDRQAIRYDPEAAKELLAEAGYPDGFSATLATENRSEHVRVAEVLQDMLADIGITVEIVQFDVAGYSEFLRAGNQELFMRQYSWHGLDILPWFLSGGQFPFPGHSRWQDPVTDELFDSAEKSPTLEARAEKYKAAQLHLIEQAVWAPIWHPSYLIAVRDEVEGLKFHPYYTVTQLLDVKVRER